VGNPLIPNLEVASRYVAGAGGVEVGGDWFSMIHLDDHRFGFVVGDVSGRGVEAAAIMARIRFTLRAYLFEGHSAAYALSMCSRQIDLAVDRHFATVLVGVGDLSTREITLSNAGHLNPVISSDSGSRFVEVAGGVPLGVSPSSYDSTTIVMEPGSTLLAFTDGLVERRDEDLDEGLQRLLRAVPPSKAPLETRLTALLAAMTDDLSDDDVAILAFRWVPADVDLVEADPDFRQSVK
jgi:serine phosphatase RsbU (regulator of sigma subunit)